jgi:hypothetical protein
VSINGGEKIWPVGRFFPRAAKLIVTYHPPIAVERLPEGTSRLELKSKARELARQTFAAVASAVAPDMLPDEGVGSSAAVESHLASTEPATAPHQAD